jgi:hypothetical protein
LVGRDSGDIRVVPSTDVDPTAAAQVPDPTSTVASPSDSLAICRDPIEAALATALERASGAAEWATVALLATELAARRAAREEAHRGTGAKVLPLSDARNRLR